MQRPEEPVARSMLSLHPSQHTIARQLGRWPEKENAVQPLHPAVIHPVPAAAASRVAQRRFLGEELSPDPLTGTPWLVKAVLRGAPLLEITRDGVIPPHPSRVLPLRHGVTGAGLHASCLLDAPGLARLRVDASGADADVECAACRAWQATHGITPRRRSAPVISRIRAALGVFSKAA